MYSTSVLLRSVFHAAARFGGLVMVLALAALCRGQSVAIGLSSGAAAAGGSVTLDLSLNAASSLPAALQWTLGYSTVDFGAATIAAGPAATAASKQLSCRSSAGSATCILWGLNETTISTGILATVTLPVNHTADSSSQLQLTGSSAAGSSGSTLTTSATGGTVTIQPGLNGFACTPVAFAPPATSSCTITLTAAAPAGGTTLALTASPASAVTLPASITIPQGSSAGAFTVTANRVTAATAVMLTASDLVASQGFGLTVNPPPALQPQITSLSPTSGAAGIPVTITGANFGTTQGASTVTFNGAAATPGGWSATSIVVPVPAAATSGNVVVTVGGVSSNGVAFTVPQTAVTLVGLSIQPTTVLGGQLAVGTLTLNAPAGAIVSVPLTASGHYGVVSVPVLVKIPIGATSGIFTILTQNVKKTTTVTVTATYGGAVKKAVLSIQPAR